MRENLSAFLRRNKANKAIHQNRISQQYQEEKKLLLCKRLLNNRQKFGIRPRKANELIAIRHAGRVLVSTFRINTQSIRQPRIAFRDLAVVGALGRRMDRT
jgi:hypothetical protein